MIDKTTLKEPLTKENFWDELYSKFPEATKVFCVFGLGEVADPEAK